ncbi:MAG: uroporphyrinogen decarboxylase family protein [Planctomycetota bacterium]|jgi:hypothetical protein
MASFSPSMTSRERITAALFGQEVDHLPFCPFLAYVWEHMPKATQEAGPLAFHQRVGADPLWRGAPCPVRAILPEVEVKSYTKGGLHVTETITPVGTLRQGGRHSGTGNTHFLLEHPLKSEEDYKVQLWIEEHTRFEYDPSNLEAHLAGDGREGVSISTLIPRGKSAFQSMIEHHVGTEELNYALLDYPETVEALWSQMLENDLTAARLAAQAPVDFFITWEDSSTQNYSPAQYEQFIGSELRQWCELLKAQKKHYIQHACGHMNDLVIPVMEAGAFAVESLSPPPTGNVSLREAREKVGEALGIIGGIEPTEFLNRTEAELPAYVEEVIADGQGGPFVLANSDSCPPGVTEEKFRIVAQAAKHFTSQ